MGLLNLCANSLILLMLIIRFKLKLLYMYSGGFYVYAIFALLFWDRRRSDFVASMVHHIATVLLIVVSYIFRYSIFV